MDCLLSAVAHAVSSLYCGRSEMISSLARVQLALERISKLNRSMVHGLS